MLKPLYLRSYPLHHGEVVEPELGVGGLGPVLDAGSEVSGNTLYFTRGSLIGFNFRVPFEPCRGHHQPHGGGRGRGLKSLSVRLRF